MSYLWKKRSGIGPKCSGDKEGIEKMNSFRKAFKNQMEKQPQPYDINMPVTNKSKKKQKRFRSAFTTAQIALLEKEFKKDPYVTNIRREQVADTLKLPERAVKIWFQNRRMKEKRDSTKGALETIEGTKYPVKITITDNVIRKLTGTCNQQTSSTSLAPKIVFENDEILKVGSLNKNDDYRLSILDIANSNIIRKGVAKVKPEEQLVLHKTVDELAETCISELPAGKSEAINHAIAQVKKIENHQQQSTDNLQPFCQVSVPAPKRSPQLLTTTLSHPESASLETLPPDTKMSNKMTSHHSTPYPIDLSKYYSSMPPVHPEHWNRYVVPAVRPESQGAPLANSNQMKKCFCDCHLTTNIELVKYQHHPLFYTHYLPHFVTPLPAQSYSHYKF